LAPATQDDGFHEIQLNGKQLVFLFMAATVVSVVIFLCGVLVGRGVRAERAASADLAPSSDVNADIRPSQPPVPAAAATADPAAAAPSPPAEDLSYFKRLEEPKQPREALKPPAKKAAPAPESVSSAATPAAKSKANVPGPSATPSIAAPPSSAATSSSAAPAAAASPSASNAAAPAPGQGYAVQIAALNVRSEADAIAKHLTSKGYSAYVSANGSPAIYRVRVGTFKTRREAESVAAKLQKEEQLKPWVTR
jgi:cell division septation protein DedD